MTGADTLPVDELAVAAVLLAHPHLRRTPLGGQAMARVSHPGLLAVLQGAAVPDDLRRRIELARTTPRPFEALLLAVDRLGSCERCRRGAWTVALLTERGRICHRCVVGRRRGALAAGVTIPDHRLIGPEPSDGGGGSETPDGHICPVSPGGGA